MSHLDRIVLFVLSALFLYAGIDKLLHYQGFINALSDYVLVPRGTASVLAMPLIAVELLAGIGLWIPAWRRSALLLSVGLLVVFSIALGFNYLTGGRRICGCWFTLTLAQGNGMHIAQNLLLAFLAAVAWWESRERECSVPPLTEAAVGR